MEEKLINIQEKYTENFGYQDKIFCFNVRTLTQIIPIILILDSLFFFIQTGFRWGAPCFMWWNSISTTITFFIGHLTRLIGIPVSIYSLIETRRGNTNGSRILFCYLFLLLVVTLMDIFFCIFEVDYVCNSESIKDWNQCSHEWGKEEYECITDDGIICNVPLIYDNMNHDKNICEENDCIYIKKTNRVKPECCSYSEWNYHNPCKSEPIIRPQVFDTSWCENFSDFYDMGIGLLTSIILFGFTYTVHSYNMASTE